MSFYENRFEKKVGWTFMKSSVSFHLFSQITSCLNSFKIQYFLLLMFLLIIFNLLNVCIFKFWIISLWCDCDESSSPSSTEAFVCLVRFLLDTSFYVVANTTSSWKSARENFNCCQWNEQSWLTPCCLAHVACRTRSRRKSTLGFRECSWWTSLLSCWLNLRKKG